MNLQRIAKSYMSAEHIHSKKYFHFQKVLRNSIFYLILYCAKSNHFSMRIRTSLSEKSESLVLIRKIAFRNGIENTRLYDDVIGLPKSLESTDRLYIALQKKLHLPNN